MPSLSSSPSKNTEIQKLIEAAQARGWQQAAEEIFGRFDIQVSARRRTDDWILAKPFSRALIVERDHRPGAAVFSFAESGASLFALALDPRYTPFANLRKKQENISNLFFLRASPSNLPFPAHPLDLVSLRENVLGKTPGGPQKLLREVWRVLKPDGELCIRSQNRFGPFGCGLSLPKLVALLKTQGFQIEKIYTPLPALENPLYWVDLNGPESWECLIRLSSGRSAAGKSWRHRLWMLAVKFAVHFKKIQWLLLQTFCTSFVLTAVKKGTPKSHDELTTISHHIFSGAQDREISFLIHSGLEIITMMALKKGSCEPLGVLRSARKHEDEFLKREYDILNQIKKNASPHFLQTVPLPLARHSVHGLDAFSMSFVRGKEEKLSLSDGSEKIRARFSKVKEWIAELNRIPVPESAAVSNRFTEARQHILALASTLAHSPAMRQVLDKVLAKDSGALWAQVPIVITHRDLGNANLLFDQDQLRVVDWGNSHYGYPLTDWIRFTGCTLLEIHDKKNMAIHWKELLLGSDPYHDFFYRETRALCAKTLPDPAWIAPLFLLSFFDFLEGSHGYIQSGWEKEYGFMIAQDVWLKTLAG